MLFTPTAIPMINRPTKTVSKELISVIPIPNNETISQNVRIVLRPLKFEMIPVIPAPIVHPRGKKAVINPS